MTVPRRSPLHPFAPRDEIAIISERTGLPRPEDAAGGFSTILAHRGVSPLSPFLILSQLGLARAYALQRDAHLSGTIRLLQLRMLRLGLLQNEEVR